MMVIGALRSLTMRNRGAQIRCVPEEIGLGGISDD